MRQPTHVNMSEYGTGRSVHKELNYVINSKAPDCYVFNGAVKDFLP